MSQVLPNNWIYSHFSLIKTARTKSGDVSKLLKLEQRNKLLVALQRVNNSINRVLGELTKQENFQISWKKQKWRLKTKETPTEVLGEERPVPEQPALVFQCSEIVPQRFGWTQDISVAGGTHKSDTTWRVHTTDHRPDSSSVNLRCNESISRDLELLKEMTVHVCNFGSKLCSFGNSQTTVLLFQNTIAIEQYNHNLFPGSSGKWLMTKCHVWRQV